MRILMACGTCRTHSKESSVEIAKLNQLFLLDCHMFGRMAPVACQSSVLPFENVSGLFVIEGLQVPFDQREIASVVLGVATRAFLIGTWPNAVAGVQASARSDPPCNFRMAIKAFKNCFTSEFVTIRALCRPVQ